VDVRQWDEFDDADELEPGQLFWRQTLDCRKQEKGLSVGNLEMFSLGFAANFVKVSAPSVRVQKAT
jgi:hypothetical protein